MITLICGVGRSGKSTYSTAFENVIHLDLLGHMPGRYDRANELVHTEADVVVEGIYNRREQRVKLAEAYKGNGRRCIWLNTPEAIVRERMLHDGIPIPLRHFDFEPPTLDEGWDEIIRVGDASNASNEFPTP